MPVFTRVARLCAYAVFPAFLSIAHAAPFGPEEATELLSKTMAADLKCKVLSETEREQLQSFVAQAELALAEQAGVPATKSALERGRLAGAKIACDATTARAVRGVLATTRDALASSARLSTQDDEQMAAEEIAEEKRAETPAAKPQQIASKKQPKPVEQPKPKAPAEAVAKKAAPQQPVASAKPTAKKSATDPIETATVKKPPAEKAKSVGNQKLSAYTKLAEAYFAELKCRTMSKSEVQAFYGKVMKNHKAAVAAHGGALVSKELRAAQVRAEAKSCG